MPSKWVTVATGYWRETNWRSGKRQGFARHPRYSFDKQEQARVQVLRPKNPKRGK